MKHPYIQFFTGDWLKDPQLSICSPATRGVWIDLLCMMHELDRCGQITGTPEQLSRASRCTSVEMNAALAELETTKAANVTLRNGIVTVVCRRMNAQYRERVAGNERVRRYRKKGDVTDLKRENNNTSSESESETVSKNDDDDRGREAELPANYLSIGVRLLTAKGATEKNAKKIILGFVGDFGPSATSLAISKADSARPNAPGAYIATILQNEVEKARHKNGKQRTQPNGNDSTGRITKTLRDRDYSVFAGSDPGKDDR
jgi:hypothetical protein